jgi:hypothetical protein
MGRLLAAGHLAHEAAGHVGARARALREHRGRKQQQGRGSGLRRVPCQRAGVAGVVGHHAGHDGHAAGCGHRNAHHLGALRAIERCRLACMSVDHHRAHAGRAGDVAHMGGQRVVVDAAVRGEGGERGGPDAADSGNVHGRPGCSVAKVGSMQ